LDRVFRGPYGCCDVFQLDPASIERKFELLRRKALFLRDTGHQDAFGQKVRGEKSRAELPSGCWPSCAVIRLADRGGNLNYDVAPDGSQLVAVVTGETVGGSKPATELSVILNIFDELRRRIP
jgi:hypothetical protein